MPNYDAIIIGAGPAGLFCASQLAQKSALHCVILEKNHEPGRKLLLTGGGHCNFTHAGPLRQFISHYGNNGAFLKPALQAFSNLDLIRYFQSKGLDTCTDKIGRVTPKSNRASDVVHVLTKDLEKKEVHIHTGTAVKSVSINPAGGYEIDTHERSYTTKILVIACGGKSYPATGSTGDGYAWARSMGHQIITPRPALTQLLCSDRTLAELSGTSLWGSRVSLWSKEKKTHTCHGDVLFTHRGLSGPAVQNISRYVDEKSVLTVQLLVDTTRKKFDQEEPSLWTQGKKKAVKTVIRHLGLSEKLTDRLLNQLSIDPATKIDHLSKKNRNILVDTLFDFPLIISGRAGFQAAMVTQGGICLDELDPNTMQSTLRPGLFFIGEILDIDGDCGGYNLQAAFSTAYLAAQAIGSHRNP